MVLRTSNRLQLTRGRGRRSRNSTSETLLECFQARPMLLTFVIAMLVSAFLLALSGNELSDGQTLVVKDDRSTSFLATTDTSPTSTNPQSIQKNENAMIRPVSCSELLASRKDDPADPNRHLDESPKKFVNMTDPNFFISLHAAHFDGLRWAHIYNKGNYYETGITEQFKSILYSAEKKGLVIDVGMNIGWFSIFSRKMGHSVVGFDPNLIMHTRVCESLELNGWLDDHTVKTFAYGLGEEAAVLNMTTGLNPGKASFFEDRMAKKFRKKMEVPVVKLDDVAQQQGWITNDEEPIYIWKIDVEGYEYHVLGGAQNLLHSGRVENILMENSVEDLRQMVDMYAAIYHAGYEIKMLSDVKGKAYHPEMVPALNAAFQQSSVGMDLDRIDKNNVPFLAKTVCNIWWKKRETSTL
jgi:FkbM family methyltransferase